MQQQTIRQQLLNWALATTTFVLSACAPMGAAPAAAPQASVAYEQAAAPAAEAPQGMFFADYGVNGFVETSTDSLSTFGVDVDTGAYTVARRYVTDGSLPPQDAVRVEEFVNFFNYHYPYPTAEQTFGIHVDGALSPFNPDPAYRMVRVGIQGYDIPAEERKAAALTFVVDVSGSMDMENRLGLVKRSLTSMVQELRPSDSVAVIVYGSSARIVLPMTSVGEQQVILAAIDSLQPDGSTNAEEGLRLGYQHAWEHFNPQAINRVILCSDGVANVGATGPEAILETIGQYAAKGITMTSVGVGMGNYNDVLMEQLADKGDGFYAYVDTDEAARRLFVYDLTGTLQTIAMDAKIQVEFNPETVARYRLVGYENRDVADDDFRDDQVDGGEVGAGHSVTALYEIELQPEAQAAQDRLATVHLRWQDPDTGEAVEMQQEFAGSALAAQFAESDAYFQLAVSAAEYAELLRGSQWAEGNTLSQLLVETRRIHDQLTANQQADAQVSEFVDLVWRAARIRGEQVGSQ